MVSNINISFKNAVNTINRTALCILSLIAISANLSAQKPNFIRGISENPFKSINYGNLVLQKTAIHTPGVGEPPGFLFEIIKTASPNWGAVDAGFAVGRKETSCPTCNIGSAQTGMNLTFDAFYDTGTPFGLYATMNSKIKNSMGTTVFYGRMNKLAESTDISIAVHGECLNRSLTGGTCVGLNTEVANFETTSPSRLVGIVAQVGMDMGGGVSGIGTTNQGLVVNVNHNGTNTGGFGAQIEASSGIHPIGLSLIETAGSWTKTAVFKTSKAPNVPQIFEMINAGAHGSKAPNKIVFSRAVDNPVVEIVGDVPGDSAFDRGEFVINIRETGILKQALLIDSSGALFMNRGWINQSNLELATATTLLTQNRGYIRVKGTGTVTAIDGCGSYTLGRVLYVEFENSGITIVDGGGLRLNNNLVATADSMLMLMCNGGTWNEISRSLN